MNVMETIVNEIEAVLRHLDTDRVNDIALRLVQAPRIFVVGEGRSGLMGRAFAMRLMHLGATSFVVGETITPAIQADDVLVAISGSGKTEQVVRVSEKAKSAGAMVVGVSTNALSDLAAVADTLLLIPAATKYRAAGEQESVQPLGSLFDQCVHVALDAISLRYAAANREDNGSAFVRHSNME
ncbi:6-phospho-3-hexuloisomerase [Alicyclobacillus fastidiosus]|uniref:6-phospho-3-hexuloisomerase n=1 Tax=Alicyclobacillus fastidiosus TaxID=392011 RepID=A0ABV5AGK8_9BACL|nr:6-phospho-3-hexuloisomerase [Alicyclobacillus fastidiosus]WEH08878.1 6-phospho-3-hexuloisomerase [Alicyclobacillus fastidiosus]